MIYLRSSKRSSWRGYGKYIPALLIVVLLVAVFFFFRTSASSFGLSLFSPLLKAYHGLVENLKLGSRIFVPDYKLEKENVLLTAEVARLRQKVLDLEVAKAENDELKKRLDLKEPSFLSATILLSPPRTPYDTILLDRGEYDGVAAGQRVLLGDKVSLGDIEAVYPNQSTVKLFSTPGRKTEATMERTGEIVELQGQGGGNFKLEMPLGFDAKEGDLVFLQGTPRRLVAKVAQVKSDETSSFLTIFLQMPSPLLGDSPIYVEVR